jgi:hypothetical protein
LSGNSLRCVRIILAVALIYGYGRITRVALAIAIDIILPCLNRPIVSIYEKNLDSNELTSRLAAQDPATNEATTKVLAKNFILL